MRFREIRTSEKITEEDEKRNKGFLNIKPEKELSVDELNDICNNIWMDMINS